MTEFDRLLDSIRNETPDAEAERAAAARVRARLDMEMGATVNVARLDSCADFRGLFPVYRSGNLSEARKMLLEDHLHSCVACRKAFSERPVVIPIQTRKSVARRVAPWAIAAAAAAVVLGFVMPDAIDRLLAPSGTRATVASVDGELYRVSASGLAPLTMGAAINENDEIRTAKGSRAVLRLRDGSMVEMAERSSLTLSERWRGKTVHLARGAVMVEAAKQRSGRLEIATPDCLVSVKGTIFQVSRGTKGSRVSVIAGEVKVDREGASNLLHRGEQTTTDRSMTKTPVAEDIAWSRNAAKYVALLGEFSEIGRRIAAIPEPGLRYQSKLVSLAPRDAVVFASIPNLGPTLAEASKVFEDRLGESAALREWWSAKESQQFQNVVDRVRTFSDYLGDEVVFVAPNPHEAVVLAEVRNPELKDFLEHQHVPTMLNPPQAAIRGPEVMLRGNVVALGSGASTLSRIAALADSGRDSGFGSSPLGERVARIYQSGAGWVFAADMEQILKERVPVKDVTDSSASSAMAGMDNVRYLVVQRRPNAGNTENSAALSFSGARHGIASWLAAPAPMGTLDFVSPEASFATSFVIRNPGELVKEITAINHSTSLEKLQQETGVNLAADIAANLGGELTVAADGPLLPTPAWIAAIEVYNPSRFESAIEQLVNARQPTTGMTLTSQQVNGLTYYRVTSSKVAYEIDYVFTDGYLLIGPSQGQLTSAIATRASGTTLPRSAAFRAQLPQDGHTNFSAILYYNMGSMVGPTVDKLKATGIMTPEQQREVDMLTSNRAPGLIYAYGEPERIVVASRTGFFGFGLDTLLGLNAKGAAALPSLLPPLISNKWIQ